MRSCTSPGCDRKHASKGFCTLHYQRGRRAGNIGVKSNTNTVASVRDNQGRKQCNKCLKWLDTAQYSVNASYADKLDRSCRECKKPQTKINNLARMGLTVEKFDQMLEAQGGVCAVCLKIADKWHIDHDHNCCPCSKTTKLCGKCVRGLLCQKCNYLLGNSLDSVDILFGAIRYLEEWNAQSQNIND